MRSQKIMLVLMAIVAISIACSTTPDEEGVQQEPTSAQRASSQHLTLHGIVN